jgi:hypothetical protein
MRHLRCEARLPKPASMFYTAPVTSVCSVTRLSLFCYSLPLEEPP